jgi:hypothetical protein
LGLEWNMACLLSPKYIAEYSNLKVLIGYDFITEFQIAIATRVNPLNDIQLAAMAENRQIAWVTVIYNNLLLI